MAARIAGVADDDHVPALAVAAGGGEARVFEHALDGVVGHRVVGELSGGEGGADDLGDVHDGS